MVKRVKLSKEVGEDKAKSTAAWIRNVKGFAGGRFYVNEFRSVFAPISDRGEWVFRYVGQLDMEKWFPSPITETPKRKPPAIFSKVILENFKGIGERQEFELRPITLLFGPNSAGKSSVIQALHYLRQALLHKDYDATRSEVGGQFVDFDGYRNVLFQRDISNNEVCIGLGFDTDISDAISSERMAAKGAFSTIQPYRVPTFYHAEIHAASTHANCASAADAHGERH